MTKRILSILVILIICISTSSTSIAISSDIRNHWARKDIVYLLERGIIYNYSDETFRPNQNITRAELMSAINNLFGYRDTKIIRFIDVDKNSWYYEDIGRAVSAGYIEGYDDGTMKPNEPITREEASKLIAIACGLGNELPKSIYAFKDANQISKETIIYVNLLNERGYMDGFQDGTFQPKRKVSRGEASVILANIRKDLDLFNEHYVSMDKPKEEIGRNYSVQTGVYGSLNIAIKEKNSLINAGFKNALILKDNGGSNYYVMASSYLTEKEAYSLKDKVLSRGYEAYITSKLINQRDIVSGNKTIENSSNIIDKEKKVVPPKKNIKNGKYSVQTGIYSTIEVSLKERDHLIASGFPNAFIIKNPGKSNYCVMADGYLSKKEADLLRTKLIAKKFEAYVTSKVINECIIR